MLMREILLKKRKFEPLNVVFMEGFWGLCLMTFIVFPVLTFIPHPNVANPDYYTAANASPLYDIFSENIFDTYFQMVNQKIFFVESLILLFSISFFNFFGLNLTKYLSTVHRTLIDACRTITVWLFQILLYYWDERAGEKVAWYTSIQLVGFIFLVAGTIIYNEVFKIPCSKYQETM